MRMWSEGLGRMELVVDFCHYKVVTEDEDTVVKGTTCEPVKWEFTARFNKEDIPGLFNMLLKPATLLFILKNIGCLFRFGFEKIFMRNRYAEGATE